MIQINTANGELIGIKKPQIFEPGFSIILEVKLLCPWQEKLIQREVLTTPLVFHIVFCTAFHDNCGCKSK